ncbi:cardiolipin synthase [Haloferula luteola]|uniref:Cardiolipin synthase n=1 Tax=Haloferula luteola TaxID=595692 RepID=A0A840UZZ1_9BACT|nr:phospholipase D-like domain-containing protein [Haloferula luteola]MBB5350396.1 cardiolipin synthase [Haloferula luteola]
MEYPWPSLLAARAPTIPEILLTLAVAILAFMFWRLSRHQECHYEGEPEGRIDTSLRALAGSTHSRLTPGNRFELIQDEAFFDAIDQAIRSARHTIHLETFLWEKGEAATLVAHCLEEASRRGVQVRLLLDAVGSKNACPDQLRNLRQAGATVRRFRRIEIANLGRWNVRDHRKILVIDGHTAFIGGHCITDSWFKDGPKLPRFRDLSACITGPIVAEIQSCFFENWTENTGELFVDDTTFPPLKAQGDTLMHLAYVKADQSPSSVQVLHHLSIAYAKERIRIQNPYFIPDKTASDALARAARRGVDVRIMIPAHEATDSPIAERAGHHAIRGLLEAGVRVFFYQKTLIHQKVIVIDGLWAGIGSSNFDDRSFEINDELTLGIADTTIAHQLETIFENDLQECREVDLETWKNRPLFNKLLDGAIHLFNEQF